jgi:4-hydroxybenzoate polyprenyltransferase
LVESWFALLKHNALLALVAPCWLFAGKARFKHEIAQRADVDVKHLPYDTGFLEYLHEQHRQGRRLVLATASHEKYAQQVANHLGIFAEVMASNAGINLKGAVKGRQLIERFGIGGFDYAGNARADLAILPHARRTILVNPERGVESAARGVARIERVFDSKHDGIIAYFRALRPHQWLKNLLVFVPLAAAHELGNTILVGQAILAFIAFSMCASSVYLLNDLLDLSADRAHPRKRLRPFAAGAISLTNGALLIPLLLLATVIVSLQLPSAFLAMLGLYYVSTIAYSFWLKRKILVDVFVLAGLYTARLLAGAMAIAVVPSFWLLAFSIFLFLSLAMVKRYAELHDQRKSSQHAVRGRGYLVVDMEVILSLGTASGYLAALVLAFYINSNEVLVHYSRPEVIWLICPLLLYWVSRIWQRAGRGQMHDDPLVYAIKDRISHWLAVVAGAILLAAARL